HRRLGGLFALDGGGEVGGRRGGRGVGGGQVLGGLVERRPHLQEGLCSAGRAALRPVRADELPVAGDGAERGLLADQRGGGRDVVHDGHVPQEVLDRGTDRLVHGDGVDGVVDARDAAGGLGRSPADEQPGASGVAGAQQRQRGLGRVQRADGDGLGRVAERGGDRRLVPGPDGQQRRDRAQHAVERAVRAGREEGLAAVGGAGQRQV